MKIILSTIFLLFGLTTISAQNYVDILKIYANTTPLNNFDTSASSTRINELGLDLTYPVKINDSNTIIAGVIYEQVQAKLFENQSPITIRSICLKAGWNKVFNNKWIGTFIVLPKIASDFVNLSNKDFQIGAAASMKYKKSNNLNYRATLYYNSELFGPFFVPMLGFYYLSSSKKWETNLMLPLQADVNYRPGFFINIGINYNGQIRSYHLTNIIAGQNSTYLAKSSNELYAYLKFNFTKALSFQTKMGHTVGRTYRVYNENDRVTFALPTLYLGGKRDQLNTDFAGGILFQLVLLYRFNLAE